MIALAPSARAADDPLTIAPGRPTDPARVGWKLHRQAVLAAAGLRVPPLVSVTVDAFRRWFAPVRDEVAARLAATDLGDPAAFQALVAELRARLLALPVPDDVARRVELAAAAAFGPDEPLAVRGSFVARAGEDGEDSAAAPAAGASETVLGATRADLLPALVRVWASVVSPAALAWRRGCGRDLLADEVAVGLQRLVPAERSFVAFTRDPTTGARELLVAAAHGPGEGIVQERADVDHVHVDPVTGKPLRARLAGEAPVLASDELAELARVAARVEALLGEGPQDLEGCFAGGELHLVQARPLQVRAAERTVLDASNVSESFPGTTRALTWSFARAFYRDAFRDALRLLGVAPARLAALEPELGRMIGWVDGRIWYRLDAFHALFEAHPLFAVYRPHWERTIGLERPLARDLPAHGPLAAAGAVANLLANAATVERRLAALGRAFEADRAEALAALRAAASARELCDVAARFARRSCEAWGPTLVNDALLILAHGALEALARRTGLLDEAPALLNDLLCGEELESAAVVHGAVALGERVQADPALGRALEREPGLDELAGEQPAFAAAVRDHLARFGARGPEDLKLEVPALRDRPGELLRIVRRYAQDGVTLEALRTREAAVRSAAEAVVARRLGRLARAPFAALLVLVRGGLRRRELSRYWRSELYATCRTLYRAVGDRLAAEGALDAADDVFDLTEDELHGAVAGTLGLGPRGLRALIALRRAELARAPAPDARRLVAVGAVAAGRFERPDDGDGGPADARLLRGLGSSAGVVRGRARVVTRPDAPLEADAEPKEATILVARETDPGWLYLMLASKGLVVERGSLLSHTAIAGRTFGIPTVVGVRGAIATIEDGEWLEVDGCLGTVRRLEAGDA